MNIMFVTPVFIERNKPASGMPNYIYRTAMLLSSLGHPCCVVCGGNVDKKENISGISVYRVNTQINIENKGITRYLMKKIVQDWLLQKKVREICSQMDISLIQFAGHSGTGMFHNPRKVKIPAVMRMSTYTKYYYACYEEYTKKLSAISFLERIAAKKMNSIYAPSRVIANALEKDIGKHVGVIESPFYNEVGREDASAYQKYVQSKRYMLYVGGMDAHKGVFVISDMLERLLKKFPAYFFVFCGPDSQGNIEKIKRQNRSVHDRIIWINDLPHNRLFPIMRNAEVVVLPSLMENLSNACMEAMNFGKIVIATDGTSYEQLIEDPKSGFLAQPGDAEDLYQKVYEALQMKPAEKEQMSLRAKERIMQLAPEISGRRLLQYYKNVCSKYCDRSKLQ